MLFQSPVKKPPTKLKKLPNLLKITKPTKLKVVAKGCGVRKQVAKTTTVKCREEKRGQAVQAVQVKVQNLIKTSSRGRKIRPTVKAI
jgi:intracellular sulfur oxidation DsrE/DsrF family protein